MEKQLFHLLKHKGLLKLWTEITINSRIRRNQVNFLVYGQDSKKNRGRTVGKIKIILLDS